MRKYIRYALTGIVVLAAAAAGVYKYWSYVTHPWTRDGQVRANVIQITPRVSGAIVTLPVRDNQPVQAGDLLFEIDPRTFEAALEQARAQLDLTRENLDALEKEVEAAEAAVESAKAAVVRAESAVKESDWLIAKDKAEYERQTRLLEKNATSERWVERTRASYEVEIEKKQAAEATLLESRATLRGAEANLAVARANLGASGDANSRLRAAKAAVRQAELNLEFTRIVAPVDGYVTNLTLRVGSQAVANQPSLALVDVNSYWVHGFFRETMVANVQPGDRVIVTLMGYPDTPLEGRVDSLGWGIAQRDGSTGADLLPNVSPTFEWIRLAQRVPVRMHLTDVPDHVALRVGTTASVLVLTGSAERDGER